MGMNLGLHIQVAEIYAEAESPILFVNKDYYVASQGLTGAYTPVSNISQSKACTSSNSRGDMYLNCSFTITCVDLMLYRTHTP